MDLTTFLPLCNINQLSSKFLAFHGSSILFFAGFQVTPFERLGFGHNRLLPAHTFCLGFDSDPYCFCHAIPDIGDFNRLPINRSIISASRLDIFQLFTKNTLVLGFRRILNNFKLIFDTKSIRLFFFNEFL